MKKTFLNWSSGKDAALSLFLLQQSSKFSIESLICTVNKDLNRISMHGVRELLLDAQAAAIGLPLQKVYLSENTSMEAYNNAMQTALKKLSAEGYKYSAFGDIFLEDLRKYREEQLQKEDLTGVFPLWKKDTKKLLEQFITLGFRAIVVCVNAKLLDKSFVGRNIDESFLKDLPDNVDACGENGEFHTFVFDGPIFNKQISFEVSEIVSKNYRQSKNEDDCFTDTSSWDTDFWYCDLIPR